MRGITDRIQSGVDNFTSF